MLIHATLLLIITMTATFAAPALEAISARQSDEQYFPLQADRRELPEQIFVPQKRAALVLDRLLIALQQALQEESANHRMDSERDGPRTAPLRLSNIDTNDMTGLQRRGQGTTRGRVLRCYFNAVTCF